MKTRPVAPRYDCMRCVAYCCGSSLSATILVTAADVEEAALALNVSSAEVRGRYVVPEDTEDVVAPNGAAFVGRWRTKKDPLLGGRRCTFLDPVTRRCGIYEHRPGVCKRYPGSDSCGAFDALEHYRRVTANPRALLILTPSAEDWPARPIALRSRAVLPALAAALLVAIGAGVACAAVAWFLRSLA